MIQTANKHNPGQLLGNDGPDYAIPQSSGRLFFIRKELSFSKTDDNVNPEERSSASQFYIVEGRTFTDKELDSVEVVRLNGYKPPENHRKVYKTIGGQLDQNYTVFGEVVSGLDVVDTIASAPTSKEKDKDKDRPLKDIRIIKAKLIKRKKH